MLARLPRSAAIAFLIAVVAACVWCIAITPPPIKVAKKGGYTDVHLYHDIADAVAKGQPYHAAAAALHRAHHYPLKPFFTMRLPTLTEMGAHLGWFWTGKIAFAAAFLAAALWVIAWMEGNAPPPGAAAASRHFHLGEAVVVGLAVGFGGWQVSNTGLMALHEYWGGLAIGIALAGVVGWPQKWWAIALPVACGLAIRELVLPFALLALAFALWERQRAEAAGWIGIILAFACYMAIHASLVWAQVTPKDIASPGWHAMQGASGFLKAVEYTSTLSVFGLNRGMLASLLPLVGWCALDGRRGAFCGMLVVGYAVMIAAFSRPDTFYWGAMMLPWYFAGFALLPRALVQLAGAIRGRPFAILGLQMAAPA